MRMNNPYPDDWDSRRRRVYERDDYTCCNCGRQGGPYGDLELHAHHIVPKSKGGTHAYSNLITACDACHTAIHSKRTLAPTVAVSEPSGSSLSIGKVMIHLLLLVTTAGVGNVIYWLYGRYVR